MFCFFFFGMLFLENDGKTAQKNPNNVLQLISRSHATNECEKFKKMPKML